jgi:methylmalonyl-CoA/ethylmalonyl-CoA epimerase
VKILGIHHISLATDDIVKYREIFQRLFGIEAGPTDTNSVNKVAISFLDFGNTKIEMIEPLGQDSSIAKFLQKRGPGIHHICVLVENLDAALEELRAKNIRLIDREPRVGAGGARIAFIHPESTGGILIELEEHS